MCGIAGIVYLDQQQQVDPKVLKRMTDSMIHRGPDDSGLYISSFAGLGNRRLSIIDLKGGHQPISNEDESIWVVFNGEIYNHADVRATLESKGHRYKTRSDTETILHAYEEYGDSCVEHFRGMFTFALWDCKRKRLFAARDRLGIKPFYYVHLNRTLAFASEIKALMPAGVVEKGVNEVALAEHFALGYCAGEETLFKGVQKLPPGHLLIAEHGRVTIRQYWDLPLETPCFEQDQEQVGRQLLEIFNDSVRLRLISEVPVGVFLSGGVDSSAIVAAISRVRGDALNTFSIRFSGNGHIDESIFANIVAKKFNTTHETITLNPKDYWNAAHKHVWYMEEPISDDPSISLLLMSQAAQKSSKVLLSGEGADELFAGYGLYKWIAKSESIRRFTGLDRLGYLGGIGRWFGRPGWWATVPLRYKYWGVRAHVAKPNSRGILSEEFWRATVPWSIPPAIESAYDRVRHREVLDQMLYLDTKIWLPNNLLTRADKMTMAASIELRVPFLDHQLVEFAFRIPGSMKIKNGIAKFIEKQELGRDLPPEIVNRRKEGFPNPISSWLRREWVQLMSDIIDELSYLPHRYFDPVAMERLMNEHRSERHNHSDLLWSLAVFGLWYNQFM